MSGEQPESMDDLGEQRKMLRADDLAKLTSSGKGRVGLALIVILGVLGLIVGVAGFTVGYTKTKDRANAGLSLAQQIDALCESAAAGESPPPVATQRLCDDAQEVIQGDPGPVGDQGPVGPQGPQGIQGYQGVAGQSGPAGAGGPPGPKGPKGDQGDQGQGVAGSPGDDGRPGSEGPQGPEGPEGPQGPKGAQGDKGDKGEAGDKGEPGDPAFPFSFSFTVTDLMGEHVYTVTCVSPGACAVDES